MDVPSLNVLIVEDEPGHAVAIQRAFEKTRPEDTVRSVGSIEEYLKALAEAAPDVIVTDIQLPDGRAFDVLESSQIAKKLPVVVMTSYGNENVAVEAMKAGAADYVVKSPEAFTQLPRTVERVIREWGHVQKIKKAQDDLVHSQSELSAIFDGTPVMLCVIDSDRRVLNANRAFNDFIRNVSLDGPQQRPCGMMGCVRASDDNAGCGFGPRCGECSLRIAMVDTLLSGTRHTDVECEIPIRRSGVEQSVVFLGSTTPLPPVDGSERALVSLLDITGRRQVEEKLRDSEEKLSSILKAIDDAIISFSSGTNAIYYCSPSSAKFFGREIEEELGVDSHRWLSYVHPDDIDVVYYAAMQLSHTNAVESECRLIRADGSVVWVLARQKLVYDSETGSLKRFDLMLTDISERKRAEQRLRESESLLARSQQVAHIGSWQVDVAAQKMVWSDELYRVLGLSPDKHAAKYETFFEIVHPDDMPAAQVSFSDFFNGNHDSLEYVHRIIRKDTAEVRYVYERCVHERDANGAIVRSIGMIQDITERRQAEEKAAEHLRELEQWYRVTLNREGRIIELKDEVNSLLLTLGREPKYGKED